MKVGNQHNHRHNQTKMKQVKITLAVLAVICSLFEAGNTLMFHFPSCHSWQLKIIIKKKNNREGEWEGKLKSVLDSFTNSRKFGFGELGISNYRLHSQTKWTGYVNSIILNSNVAFLFYSFGDEPHGKTVRLCFRFDCKSDPRSAQFRRYKGSR